MRKLCWFALPFCAAIFAACFGLPSFLFLPIVLTSALLGILTGCLKRLPVCLACLGLAFGILWFQGYTHIFRVPAETLSGQTAEFSATVIDWPKETSTGNVQVEVRLHLANAPDPKVFLYADASCTTLSPGDHLSGFARFQLAETVRGEHVTYYEAKGIFLRASLTSTPTVNHTDHPPAAMWPTYFAQAIKESIADIFPADTVGLMTALLTGDKAALADGTYAALQRSGAAHIAAVSGLHLSFFAGFLALLFRRRSKIGAVLTLILVFLFCAVTGFTPSVMRAAFMIFMTLLAPLVNREEDRPTTLTLALFLLVLWNPYSSLSISLQLSFASVAGIYLVAVPLYQSLTQSLPNCGSSLQRLVHKLLRILSANLSVTLGALLFTTPLTAIYFGSVSIIAPLTNLLILWAVSLAFAPGLILTLLGIAFPGFSAILIFPVATLIRYILSVTRILGKLPFAALSMNSGYLCAWLILFYVILVAALIRHYRRPVIPVCAGIVSLCAALLLNLGSVLSYPLSITALDVGQGQSILLCSDGYTALIDCGGTKGNAGDIAADYLQSLGISQLDLLVLTHCHNDHANGVPELLNRIGVSALILPDLTEDESPYRSEILSLAEDQNIDISLISDNRSLAFGESSLTLYAPLSDGGINEEGLFVLASCENFDCLITGDANAFVESLLVKYGNLPDIEILVAGHHGSKNSTSNVLLDAVTPETCLISVGYNTYGHPEKETLSQLTIRDIDIYRTDLMGHLTIRYKGD